MASSKEYLDYILEQLSDLSDISYRYMMSEYVIYFHNVIIGGIYDNRLLLKKTKSIQNELDEIIYQIPYPGAKEMVLVDVDNKELLIKLIELAYIDLNK